MNVINNYVITLQNTLEKVSKNLHNKKGKKYKKLSKEVDKKLLEKYKIIESMIDNELDK